MSVMYLSLQGEAAVLRVQVGALAGQAAVQVVAAVELQPGRVGGEVHRAAGQRGNQRGRQHRPDQ